MKAKVLEIRDRGTYLPVLAVKLEPSNMHECGLLARAGFGPMPSDQAEYVVLSRINGGHGELNCDPYDWCDRTLKTAHNYIVRHFDDLKPFETVDVEYILGEKAFPASSEHL